MADLTITAGNVGIHADAETLEITFGATVTPGQVVYLDTTDGEHKLADADDSQTTANAAGIAITAGGDGEAGIIVTQGEMDVGATLTVGEIYVVSGTAGGIAPEGDLATGDYVTILGVAKAADKLDVQINVSDTQVP